uniref:Uncharacterized protein n=1 Tax=viral metagenome TaxID=1070528 RepID=A0A6C0EQZ1_9ZZZZ
MQKTVLQVCPQYDLYYLFSLYNICILYNRINKMNTTKNNTRRKKWSLKYKRSINCKKPKGFSQRQHCKYGKRPKTIKKWT